MAPVHGAVRCVDGVAVFHLPDKISGLFIVRPKLFPAFCLMIC